MERLEFTREFKEGEGWVVKEKQPGQPLPVGASRVQMSVPAPPIAITLETVPYDLAVQVVKNNGMFVVPLEFLSDEARETMLEIDTPGSGLGAEGSGQSGKPEKVDEAVKRVMACATLDEITAIVEKDTRKAVIKAAEDRAAELTEGK